MKFSHILQFSIFSLMLSSCASKPSRPVLYPNQMYKDRAEHRQNDIDECLKEADAYAKTPEGERLQRSANSASVGTSIGLGFGTVGSGVGLGFGVGSGGGGQTRLSGEEQVRRSFSNQCLVNKGYQIVGWDNG